MFFYPKRLRKLLKGPCRNFTFQHGPFLIPEEGARKVIELGAVFPEAVGNEEIVAQLRKMLAEPDFGNLFRLGRPGGSAWQKESAAKLMRMAGYEVDPKRILLASGGQNAIAAILAGLFQPGDRIGTDSVTYPGMKTAANMLGIQLIPITQKNNEMSEDGIRYACKNENIKGLYVIPDYHNPTTHTMSGNTRKKIAAIARQEQLIVIEDTINSLLNEHPLVPIAVYAPEQVLYLSSLSKVVAPGLRIAFVAVPEQYHQKLSEALYNLNFSVPPLMAELAARMIVSGAVEKITSQHRQQNRLRNAIVDRYLGDYQVLGEPECLFRWLLLPEKFSGESFEAQALQAGVRVYGAERFAVGNARPISAARLAIGAPESLSELEEALKMLKGILGS